MPDSGDFRIRALLRDERKGRTFGEDIPSDGIGEWLASGTTICVNNIGAGDMALSRFASIIKEQLGFVGSARFNCYLSPDKSGADTHLDAKVAMTLQIEGQKRWRFSSGVAMEWPPSNAQLRPDGTTYWVLPGIENEPWTKLERVDEAAFNEVLLSPGDLLCLPAGSWHSAKAVGSSLALNLAFAPINFYFILMRLLDPTFRSHSAWRGSPPPALPAGADEAIPFQVEGFLADRLTELRHFLDHVDLKDPQWSRIWKELIGE
jgi:hypothetical protein